MSGASERATDELGAAGVAEVRSGMVVGLGTGRAAARGIRALAARVRNEGLAITCVATSRASEELAVSLGLTLADVSQTTRVDYLFDGADEVDPAMNMLKGGGGAMTRERIVAAMSTRRVYMVDEAKLVSRLGERMPLPVEIIPMALASVRERLAGELGLEGPVRETSGQVFVSDNGCAIVDAKLGATDVVALAAKLDTIAGVVDHGLFLSEAQTLLVETKQGLRRMERSSRG